MNTHLPSRTPWFCTNTNELFQCFVRLVHYDPGQEYTAHHDFGFSDLSELQGARFSTLLLYLNDEGLIGGETTFPRYVNAESFDKLKVKPEEGKVSLFMRFRQLNVRNPLLSY